MATQTNERNIRTLEDEESFEFLSGLWTGKKPPFTKAVVIRNTNFSNDGKVDYSNMAVLDVEAKQLQSRRLLSGDIIIERSGGGPQQPVGRVVYFEKETQEIPYSFSNFTSTIRVKKNFDSRYVFYFLHNFYAEGNTGHLQRRTTGIRNLDFKSYKQSIIFPTISVIEQKAIAHALMTVQDAIAEQEKMLAKLKELKRSTMQHLFTHGTKGEKTKMTEAGEVPESWEMVKFGSACDVFSGFAFKSKDFKTVGVPVVKIGEIQDGKVTYSKRTDFVPQEWWTNKKLEKYKLSNGDVLIAMTGATTGKIGVFRNGEAFVNQRVGKLVPTKMNNNYLLYFVQTDYFFKSVIGNILASAQGNVSPSKISNIDIALPDMDEQERIAKSLIAVEERIETIQSKLSLHRNLFKTLLHELMSGKRRIKNI